jgi:hypothetical protein
MQTDSLHTDSRCCCSPVHAPCCQSLQPARDVKALPHQLPELVANRLEGLGIPSRLVDAEVAAMTPVSVARTVDRSVLGILVDFANYLSHGGGLCDIKWLSLMRGNKRVTNQG